MSIAISRVPAATTLQDMRSKGPPEDREGGEAPGLLERPEQSQIKT